MIIGAQEREELKLGGKVVEYMGGSTGSSLAMVRAQRGYKCNSVCSNGFSEEKLQTMRTFSAGVEIVHAQGGVLNAHVINRIIARTKELVGEPGVFWPDQINNTENNRAYHAMARRALPGRNWVVLCRGEFAARSY